LFNTANPRLAQGAALADMALCDRFEDGDVTKLIHTGYELIFEPDQGVVTITRKA
jgi:hypothetical protein